MLQVGVTEPWQPGSVEGVGLRRGPGGGRGEEVEPQAEKGIDKGSVFDCRVDPVCVFGYRVFETRG